MVRPGSVVVKYNVDIPSITVVNEIVHVVEIVFHYILSAEGESNRIHTHSGFHNVQIVYRFMFPITDKCIPRSFKAIEVKTSEGGYHPDQEK